MRGAFMDQEIPRVRRKCVLSYREEKEARKNQVGEKDGSDCEGWDSRGHESPGEALSQEDFRGAPQAGELHASLSLEFQSWAELSAVAGRGLGRAGLEVSKSAPQIPFQHRNSRPPFLLVVFAVLGMEPRAWHR
jgi:hypothetical protein